MSWYDYIPSVYVAHKAKQATDAMGITGDINKNLYQFQHQPQIEGAINQGLATNRTAPQVGMGNDFRSAQMQQLGQLQGLASGQMPTAGELAVRRQAAQQVAQQQAAMRMARGGDAVLAQRAGAGQIAGIGINAQGAAQRAALEGQGQAQGLLTQAAGQGRGQDMQVQIANMDAQLKQMGMDDQTRLAYLSQLTGMDAAQLQAYVAAKTGQQQMQGALLSGLGQGASKAAVGMFSDERLKTDIADADEDVDAMLDALVAKRYRYKDQKHGEGERVGIMAQHMRQSRAGADVTFDTDEGIALDVNKAISAALASVARLNKRLRAVEAK
jgi:hypothetical protein